MPKQSLLIRFNVIGILSAAVSAVIAIAFGVYSFGGFSQQLANNIPLPDNPLTNLQNVDTNTSPNNPNVDPTLVSRLVVEEGFDQDTATLIAQIDTQIKTYGGNYLNYQQTLSDQMAWDVQIKAIPDQTYIPTEAELETAATTGREIYDVSYSFEEIGGVPQFTLRYFVPYEAMSEELKASIQSNAGLSASAAAVGFLPSAEASGGATGAVFETIIKGLAKEGINKLGDFSNLFAALDAATGAYKLSQSKLYFSELDQLRACAENPTNPLTMKTYQENPSEKAKAIDQVNEAQSQVNQLTTARLLNLAAKTGSKFLPGSQIFAVKLFFDSVAKWNDETLKEVSERWVDDARKAVVKCESAATGFKGTIQYRASDSMDSRAFSDDCNSYNACFMQKEQQSGGGTFFVKVVSGWISGNGTGTYEGTRTRVITGTPEHPLTEYNGEYNFVISGDVVIKVEGAQFPTVRITVNGAGLLTEEGSSTHYVADYGDSKVKPVTEEIHRETSGGFVCHFEGVDFVKGGKYKEDIIWGETVVGSCEMELLPE